MNSTLAKKATEEILDRGLKESTWAKQYPAAYRELLAYRVDIERSIDLFIDPIRELTKRV